MVILLLSNIIHLFEVSRTK